MTDFGAAAPALVACTVARRGRVLVGEPLFDPGPPLTLGRRAPVAEGELVLVEPAGRGGGRVYERLGDAADIDALMHALAGEAGLADPWPADALAELDRLPHDPLPEDPGRRDLRGLETFTIDPQTARDFDDALSVDLGGDPPAVSVHIADVSAFVAVGCPLDAEAEWRSTSTYLPGRVDPMLPPELSDGVCSLQPGRDRWTLTVELRDGRPARFSRSVIRSAHRLTYAQADAILAGGPAPGGLGPALAAASAAAEALRRRRLGRGALDVEGGDTAFTLAEGVVADARPEPGSPAHTLIEQLMIAANEAVAELLSSAGRAAIYRVHEPPDAASLEALVERFEALEVPTPAMPELHTGTDSAAYAGRLSAAVAAYSRTSGRGRHAFTSLVLRALRQARYDPANLGHSGLASSAYCHFTSPIRRYPDLVCHRALVRQLGLEHGRAATDMPAIAEHSSRAERAAADLERRGADICLAHLLDRRLYEAGWGARFDGEVVGVIGAGAFVRFGGVFEGLLPARLLGTERYHLDPLGVALVGARSGHRLRLGDPIAVSVRSIDKLAGKVLLESPG